MLSYRVEKVDPADQADLEEVQVDQVEDLTAPAEDPVAPGGPVDLQMEGLPATIQMKGGLGHIGLQVPITPYSRVDPWLGSSRDSSVPNIRP